MVYDDGIASSMDPAAEIDLLIAETNRIYQASGVDIRFEAVDPLNYQPEDTSDFANMLAYANRPRFMHGCRQQSPTSFHILKKDKPSIEQSALVVLPMSPFTKGQQGCGFVPWGTTRLGDTSSYDGIYRRGCPATFAHEVGTQSGACSRHCDAASIRNLLAAAVIFQATGLGHSWDIYNIAGYSPQTIAGTLMSYAGVGG